MFGFWFRRAVRLFFVLSADAPVTISDLFDLFLPLKFESVIVL